MTGCTTCWKLADTILDCPKARDANPLLANAGGRQATAMLLLYRLLRRQMMTQMRGWTKPARTVTSGPIQLLL